MTATTPAPQTLRAARILLALSLPALLGSLQPAQAELPARIKDAGKVVNAIEAAYAPLEQIDPATNEIVGFDVDLLNAMSAKLGLGVEQQNGAFEQLTPSLQSGRADLVMSGFYDTPKRRETFDFVDYLKAGAQFYTLTSLKDVQGLADLCGQTVTTNRGTSFPDVIKAFSDETCVAEGKEPIEVMVDTDLGQQLTNLKTGRAVAAVRGLEAVPTVIQMDPTAYRPLGEPISAALMGIAFRKEDTALRDAYQGALKTVIADGTYDALLKKWKIDLSGYTAATINAGPQP